MPDSPAPGRRETRLLVATIVVSVGMLLLLSRLRFPDAPDTAPDVAAAPLDRLAASATYDELAAIMADVQRRVAPAIDVVRIQPERAGGGLVPAVRVTTDRSVVLLAANEQIVAGATAGMPLVVGRDATRELAVVAAASGGAPVNARTGPPRPGPRYVAVLEATQQGPAIRPVYVGRIDLLQDPRSNTPALSVAALQQTVPRGAAVFALDGQFIGIASDIGGALTIIPGESLVHFAQASQATPTVPGDLGVEVQPLTAALARASGADRGVMVSYVPAAGPAADALAPGDVIQSIDGVPISTIGGFQQVAGSQQPGKTVKLEAVRQGRAFSVSVRAIERSVLRRPPASEADHGLTLRSIPRTGLEIVALEPDSAAARADLQPGEVIVAVNGRAEMDAAAVSRLFRALPRGSAVLLTVRRGAAQRVVALEKP